VITAALCLIACQPYLPDPRQMPLIDQAEALQVVDSLHLSAREREGFRKTLRYYNAVSATSGAHQAPTGGAQHVDTPPVSLTPWDGGDFSEVQRG
jgi:hypothetical protein